MTQAETLVRYIDVQAWQGWRHTRLRQIWAAIARYYHDGESLTAFSPYFNNGKLSHGQCLQEIWDQRGGYDAQFLLITELDFLPSLRGGNWLSKPREAWFDLEAPIFAPVKQRANAGDTETWFMLLDLKDGGPELRWEHERDPGADLHEQVTVQHFKGRLGYGGDNDHMGWEYPWGVHLLGSRHLHDPVGLPLWDHSGRRILAGELQANHDASVSRWVRQQPEAFQKELGE